MKNITEISRNLRALSNPEGKPKLYLGQLQNVAIQGQTDLVIDFAKSPHILIAGQTRSGKTSTLISLMSIIKTTEPETEFLLADGLCSMSYDFVTQKLSKYPVAKLGGQKDPLKELESLVDLVWKEYESRMKRMQELQKRQGRPCRGYLEYNQLAGEKERISRLVLVIDEFSAFARFAKGGLVEKGATEEGSVWYKLKRLLCEAADTGINIIISSQRVQGNYFPASFRSAFSAQMIHCMFPADARYLNLEGVADKLEPGAFILKVVNFSHPKTGENAFEARFPKGDDAMSEIIEKLEDREHSKL